MQDDARADLLYRALVEGEPLPADMDDAELTALVGLGAELSLHGATIALIEEADARFDPAFSRQLRGTLVAAHPATAKPEIAPEPAVTTRAIAAVSRRSRRLWRRLALAVTVVLALVAATVIALTQSSRPASQLGLARLTATALSKGVQAPRHASTTNAGATVASHGAKSAATAAPDARIMQTYAQDQTAKTPTARQFVPSQATPLAAKALSYQLAAKLPAVPSAAPVYRVRYNQISSAAYQRIVTSFPELRATGAAEHYGTTGGDSLIISRQNGEVTYAASTSGARSAARIPAEKAERLAIAWLAAHGLLPAVAGNRYAAVSTSGGITLVRFDPAIRFPVTGNPIVVDLTVRLAPDGHIISAHRLWPSLTPAGDVRILTPQEATRPVQAAPQPAAGGAGATPRNSSTPGQSVQVTTVSLVYAPVGIGPTLSLRPFYSLRGHRIGVHGPASETTYVVPASKRSAP